MEGALFYSHLTDALVSVLNGGLNQRVNIGSADYYGGEISLTAQVSPTFQAGVNYSYIHRTFDVGTPPAGGLIRDFALTDVPENKGFAWLSWRPIGGLNVVPSLEFASGRTTVSPATANANKPLYYETQGYIAAGLRIDYDVTRNLTVGIGAKNLFDKNYLLTDGFPEPGRSFFASIRGKY